MLESFALCLLAFVPVVPVPEKPLPPGTAPSIIVARAEKNDGKVFVITTAIVHVPVQKTEIVNQNGIDVQRVVTAFVPEIRETRWVADGKNLIATRKNGKVVEPADLPRLLEKAAPVVLFEQIGRPDSRYLRILSDDVLILQLQPRLPLPVPGERIPEPKKLP